MNGGTSFIDQSICNSILDLAKIRNWNSVILRSQTHPDEALMSRGKLSENVLHWACFHGCPLNVIDALIVADPAGVVATDQFRQTPMHVLCSKFNHSTLGNDIVEILQSMIRANSSVIDMCDLQGNTPFESLWMSYYLGGSNRQSHDIGSDSEARTILDAANVMMCTTFQQTQQKWSLLHDIISNESFSNSMRCSFVNFAIHFDPALARKCNSENRYPLHAAVSFCHTKDSGNERLPRCFKRRHQFAKGCGIDISKLVQAYPEAAAVRDRRSGRFPLFVAIENKRTWNNGIKSIVSAAPEVLFEKDLKMNMYAFQAAAVGLESDTTTIYKLLRECPSIVHSNIL